MGKSGKEVGIAVGRAFTVFQCVGVSREALETAPDASVVLAYLGDDLDFLCDPS